MMMLARTDSVGSIGYRLNLQSAMASFLFESFPEITVHKDHSIEMTYDIAAKACPSYVDGKDVWSSGIIDRFISECPDNSLNAQKVKYVKARIIEAFHLEDKKHPKWIQSPEWPFANGRPMKFVKTTVKHKKEWYQHHFVDLETGEERIVDDMY